MSATNALERIGELLRAVHLDGALTAPEAIRSIVDERLRATGASSLDAYAELAARSSDEVARLREQIAVPETWLFRYPGSFEALQHRMSTSTSRLFRVLSVACATGAEPFSIAATALSAGLRPDQVSVIGIDPNPAALASARRAELGRMAVRGELPTWASPWIESKNGVAKIDPAVRACCEFREGVAPTSLIDLPAGSFDAVFCRNLAIYLGESGRRVIGERLAALLKPDGMLFLGHAERPALFGLEATFEPASPAVSGSFAFSRRSTPAPTKPMLAAFDLQPQVTPWESYAPPRATPAPSAPVSTRSNPAPAAAATASTPAAPASAASASSTNSQLLAARAAADAGNLARAAELTEHLHAAGDRSLALMELQGAIFMAMGDATRAENVLRQVVYLDPGNVEALLHLAVLAERRGDGALALRYRQRAAKGAS
jgi:chemotaxis protein methyltransferase WspC